MKTIEEVGRFFIENKIKVTIIGNQVSDAWYMTAEKKDGSIELKVTEKGDDLLEIMILVAEKFEQFVRKGAPYLLAPQLEYVPAGTGYKTHTPTRNHLDDDIPF